MEKQASALSTAALRAGWVWMAFDLMVLPQLIVLLGLDTACSNALFQGIGFLAAIVIFHPLLLEGFRSARANPKRFAFVCALALVGYYLAGFAISRLIGWLATDFVNENDQVFLKWQGKVWLLFVTTVILAPLSEECIYRGLLFGQLRLRSRWAAYTVSSLCFGLIHVLGFWGQYSPVSFLLALLQYLPAGLLLAWSREKTQSILAPIVIHMIINAVSMAYITF